MSRDREKGGSPQGKGGGGRQAKDGGERQKSRTSPWEWAAGIASGLLVLGAIAFLLYDGLAEPSTPPKIEIVVDGVRETGMGQFLVEFRARNTGQSTAANLLLEGELASDTGTVETAQVTLPYLPAESVRAGGLYFNHDPRRYALQIRPKGYDRP